MLKRLISICLCTFMLCTMIFTTGVSAADGSTPYEVTDAVFTDELESMDYMYSYPNVASDWHLELFTQFYRESNDGNAMTGVGYRCGQEGIKGWSISDANVIWYKAGEVNGFDKKFTKAEFTVWINNDTYNAGRTPVLKVKDSVNGEVSVLADVVWTKTTNASANTDWNCQLTGTVTLPQGAEFVGLGFDTDTTITKNITDRYFYLDKVVLNTGAEAVKYYNDGSTLDDAWSYTKLAVVDDSYEQTTGTGDSAVTDIANYNNGGKMIGLTDTGAFEVVYKVPEGKSFKSFFTEVSFQDTTAADYKLAYSENGTDYTDFTFSWIQGGKPGSFGNAGWASKYSAAVTAPENTNIKFIKLYHGEAGLDRTYKFYLRKVSMLTTAEVSGKTVVDELTGSEAAIYDISNMGVYNLIDESDAKNIATYPDKFKDSNLLGIKDVTSDAYIVYKTENISIFKNFEVQFLTKDTGSTHTVRLYASKNGVDYDFITETESTIYSSIHSSPGDLGTEYGWVGYNGLRKLTADFTADQGYKYVKVLAPANIISSAYMCKLANATMTTRTAPEYTTVAPGFKEGFADTENLCDLYGIYAYEPQKYLRPLSDAVGEGKTEPVYAMYQIADGKSFGYVKAIFKQTDISSQDNVAVYALDADKNVIEWDNSSLWSVYTHPAGANVANEYIFKGEVPANAKYLKLQMNYLEDDWRCVICGFEVYGPYTGSIYSVDEEGVETDLNGVLASGDIKGKVTFENLDSGSKTVYAIAALKDGDTVTKAAVKSHTLSNTGVVTLDTAVLEGCEVDENTTLEIFLFDVTGGNLAPIMPEKIVY